MTGGVGIPCGSLPADGDAGARLSLYHGGVIDEGGQAPVSQCKSQGNRVPSSLLQRVERKWFHAGVVLHITVLRRVLLPHFSGSTARHTFPSASWLQSQHALPPAASPAQKVTCSKGLR